MPPGSHRPSTGPWRVSPARRRSPPAHQRTEAVVAGSRALLAKESPTGNAVGVAGHRPCPPQTAHLGQTPCSKRPCVRALVEAIQIRRHRHHVLSAIHAQLRPRSLLCSRRNEYTELTLEFSCKAAMEEPNTGAVVPAPARWQIRPLSTTLRISQGSAADLGGGEVVAPVDALVHSTAGNHPARRLQLRASRGITRPMAG